MRRATPARALTAAAFLAVASYASIPAVARAEPAAPGADRPPVVPTRDAAVTYEMHAAGRSQTIKVEFGDGGDALRIDNPAAFGNMIFDRHADTLTVVMQQPRAYMVVPLAQGGQNPFLLDPSQKFRRLGTTETIAGTPCNDWEVSSPKGTAKACVTDWGLLLSQAGADPSGQAGTLVATSVSTDPLPASTFQPPAGFTRIAHPGP